MSQTTKGYIIAFTGITVWSTTAIFIGYLLTNFDFPPLLLSFWRSFLVCIALIPTLFFIRRSLLRIERSQIKFYAFYGFFLAVFNSNWALSVQGNGAAVATVLAYSSAGFTAVLAWWFFKERIGLPKIAAIVLSIIGCVLVAKAHDPQMWNLNPMGIITGLASGGLFAGYNIMGKMASRRGYNPWTSLLYSFMFAALFNFMFNLLPILPGAAGSLAAINPNLPPEGWRTLIFLSFVPTLFGFGLYTASMNYLPASTVSLLATTEPAMTAVEAYIFLHERLELVQIIGSLITLSAVVALQFERDERSDS